MFVEHQLCVEDQMLSWYGRLKCSVPNSTWNIQMKLALSAGGSTTLHEQAACYVGTDYLR